MVALYVFFIFFIVLVVLSVLLATFQNPIYNVLALIAIFIVSAFFLLLNGIEFFSLILVMVYVGAVIVFFLFVTMILEFSKITVLYVSSYIKFSIISIFFLFLLCLRGFDFLNINFITVFSDINNLTLSYLSEVFYASYFFTFIFSSVLLLVSIIGCITLSSHLFVGRKTQKISDQQLKSYIYNT